MKELRFALTVPDYETAIKFYRDVLGLEQIEAWNTEDGPGAVLKIENATLEILSESHAAGVDRIEVGKQVSGTLRLAIEVDDSEAEAKRLVKAGAEQVSSPVLTPWQHLNIRIQAPDGMQITLYSAKGEQE
jgi:catechol 2,3-dioxygenase-like lactoylglutathione lyase family enzyme